ncbi:tetratricopeptide repeat protein [Palleronia sediminis]|uniref:Tetratricopeptide repeat protein n=1 Tax=Palleronia sediminis TaxID=2547833 RepID=A0A4R6AI33_9RHOB|nr:tetratricopeptide repeat protein [Palleronia sediminis]TDL83580.1 tetratricopeptide repeat protein [Palleronia sediminis]
MDPRPLNLKPFLAIAALALWIAPASAQDRLDSLFDALRTAQGSDAEQIAGKIASEWSKSGSPTLDYLLDRGRAALDEGETARAIFHLGAAIDHAPDFAEGYNLRATAYFLEGQFGPALEDIRRALTLNPRHFGAMTGLAVILQDIGEPEAALEVWRSVARLYPANPQAEMAIPKLEREVDGLPL